MTEFQSKLDILRMCFNHFSVPISKLYKGQILISYILTDGNRIVHRCEKSVKCLVKDIEIISDDGVVTIGDNHDWIELDEKRIRHADVIVRFGTLDSGLDAFEFKFAGANEDVILQFVEMES